MKRNVLVRFVGVAVAFAGSLVWADGFRNPPDGAMSLGRVGGTYAQIDDASSVSRNPANMADITNVQYEASVTLGYASKKFTRSESAAGPGAPAGTAESKDNFAALPDIYTVVPIDQNFVGGIAITTPFGRSTTWEKDSILRYNAPYFSRLIAVNANPNVAMKVGERISIAAGVDVLWSQLDIKQIYPWSQVPGGDPSSPDGEMEFKGDGIGFGGNAALNFDVTDRQKLSLIYRSPINVQYEGHSTVSEVPPQGANNRSDLSSDITFPALAALAYGIRIGEAVRVEANVEWVQHSTFDHLNVDAGSNNALLLSTKTAGNWKDTWTYGLGADWNFAPAWTARLGWIHLDTPIPESTLIPSVAEENQDVVSIGFGWAQNGHRVDIAYVYGIFDGRTVDSNDNPAYNGKYDFASQLLAVSYGSTF